MKRCCESMAEMINDEHQGQRGFFVQAPCGNDSVSVKVPPCLVFRSFDEGQENDVHIEASVPVSIEGKVGFTFCPWCGTRLYRLDDTVPSEGE